jgi:hypothetical protein
MILIDSRGDNGMIDGLTHTIIKEANMNAMKEKERNGHSKKPRRNQNYMRGTQMCTKRSQEKYREEPNAHKRETQMRTKKS